MYGRSKRIVVSIDVDIDNCTTHPKLTYAHDACPGDMRLRFCAGACGVPNRSVSFSFVEVR